MEYIEIDVKPFYGTCVKSAKWFSSILIYFIRQIQKHALSFTSDRCQIEKKFSQTTVDNDMLICKHLSFFSISKQSQISLNAP